MLESGLRFAFAFLPAGVAVIIGLVIAVQRRRVLPEVSTPAIWGLGLQLLAILVSASVNLVPSLFLGAGVQTALTVSVVIGIITVLLTVVSWVLILTALFRRLPAGETPTTATPAQATPAMARRVGPTPPADDAPTGRHALLDERGQQVVAQEGVRLYPQAAAIAGGVATGAVVAGRGEPSGPLPADGSRVEEMPTEAVPVLRRPTGDDVAPGGAASRSVDDAEPAGSAGSADQPDPGPAGVDEAAVGGTPTGPADEPAASSPAASSSVPATGLPAATPVATSSGTSSGASSATSSGPSTTTPAAPAATPAVADEGPAGVDEAAVGGTPVEASTARSDDASASTATLGGLAAAASVPGLDPAADDPSLDDPSLDVPASEDPAPEESRSKGSTPQTPAADGPAAEPAEPATEDAPPPDPSPVSVDEGAVGGVPTGPAGADTPPRVTAPAGHPAPASHPGPGSALRPATPAAEPATPSTSTSSPAGAVPRTPSPTGADLFAPTRPEEPSSVPGWFEPVTDSRPDLDEPAVESRNGHPTEH